MVLDLKVQPWEQPLLSLADEARLTTMEQVDRAAGLTLPADVSALDDAYARCEEITAEHSRSFHLASGLLPYDKRRAARALYAFCRVTDDIVDHPEGDVNAGLATWQDEVFVQAAASQDPVAVAWADARSRFNVPQRFAEQLVEGVTRDLHQTRYDCFDDLAAYSYGVASTVGLMSMHIIGFNGRQDAVRYAIKLGVALQLTNILRDIGEDWRRGRLYLPLDELKAYGLRESDIAAARIDDRWRAFMRFQIARNRRLYDEAWEGIGMLDRDGRVAIAAAATFYRVILNDIEAADYDVFSRRAHVGRWGKLRLLPNIWWQSRRFDFGRRRRRTQTRVESMASVPNSTE